MDPSRTDGDDALSLLPVRSTSLDLQIHAAKPCSPSLPPQPHHPINLVHPATHHRYATTMPCSSASSGWEGSIALRRGGRRPSPPAFAHRTTVVSICTAAGSHSFGQHPSTSSATALRPVTNGSATVISTLVPLASVLRTLPRGSSQRRPFAPSRSATKSSTTTHSACPASTPCPSTSSTTTSAATTPIGWRRHHRQLLRRLDVADVHAAARGEEANGQSSFSSSHCNYHYHHHIVHFNLTLHTHRTPNTTPFHLWLPTQSLRCRCLLQEEAARRFSRGRALEGGQR